MIYLSSLLRTKRLYQAAADRLSAALDAHGVEYAWMDGTKDIWMRDFMPVRTASGMYVSFRYRPSYLRGYRHLQTDFCRDIRPRLSLPLIRSDINLDGGNIVFSPSRSKAIISDRLFSENPTVGRRRLMWELEALLKAQVILIPALPPRLDMTGHADGMVRFVDENTVVGNRVFGKHSPEQAIKNILVRQGLRVVDFPFVDSGTTSAVGCYLNFLQTESHLFLPVFGIRTDADALAAAKAIFPQKIVPVNINEVARQGGVLNCISWEAQP